MLTIISIPFSSEYYKEFENVYKITQK